MKRTVLCAAALCALAPAAFAQSNVTIYGIVDAAVRMDTNAGAKGPNSDKSIASLAPGGMSQSRIGFRVNEDLGGGMAANANFEHRFNSDTGAQSAAEFWRQAWVGLTTSYGQVMLGRQYNVLFDITTSTFASFKYSPYIEAFKPEIGMSLGARTSNTVKYVLSNGGFRGALAASAGERAAGKSMGGYLRYETGPIAVGGGYEVLEDVHANKVKGMVIGGAYTIGPVVLTASWAKTDPDDKYDRASLATTLGNGGTNGAFAVNTNLDSRTMYSLGALYQATKDLNLGLNYWNAKQKSMPGTTNGEGKARFIAAVADYALSKRTDVYLELDNTKLGDNLTFSNLETKRTGYMVGVRHRF